MPGSARYNRRSLEPRRVALLPQPMKFKGEIATLVSAAAHRKNVDLDRIKGINKKRRGWFRLNLVNPVNPVDACNKRLIDTQKSPLYDRNTCRQSKLPLITISHPNAFF